MEAVRADDASPRRAPAVPRVACRTTADRDPTCVRDPASRVATARRPPLVDPRAPERTAAVRARSVAGALIARPRGVDRPAPQDAIPRGSAARSCGPPHHASLPITDP